MVLKCWVLLCINKQVMFHKSSSSFTPRVMSYTKKKSNIQIKAISQNAAIWSRKFSIFPWVLSFIILLYTRCNNKTYKITPHETWEHIPAFDLSATTGRQHARRKIIECIRSHHKSHKTLRVQFKKQFLEWNELQSIINKYFIFVPCTVINKS